MENKKAAAVDMICDAMVDLLFDKPLGKIKIQEIVEKAGINKSTYYYHFYSKEDVIEEIINRFVKGFISAVTEHEDSRMEHRTEGFYYFYDNRDIYMVLKANGYQPYVHSKMVEELVKRYSTYSYDYKDSENNLISLSSGPIFELANRRFASSFIMYLEYWEEKEYTIPIDIMVEYSRTTDSFIAVSFEKKKQVAYK